MTQLTNITSGPKGIHAKDGALVMLEPGASANVDLGEGSFCEDWFVSGDKGLASLSVADLKALAKQDDIDLGDATKKADIIAAIELHREAAAA